MSDKKYRDPSFRLKINPILTFSKDKYTAK